MESPARKRHVGDPKTGVSRALRADPEQAESVRDSDLLAFLESFRLRFCRKKKKKKGISVKKFPLFK
jgi:hypothetical protein